MDDKEEKNIIDKEKEELLDNKLDINIYAGIGTTVKSLIPVFTDVGKIVGDSAYQITKLVNPMQEIIKSINEMMQPIINQVINSIPKMTPYFKDLADTIEKIQKNPNSIFNWIDFSKTLSNYFWLPPYLMESSQLMELLKIVENEEQMDKELEKYFTDIIISDLFNEVIDKSLDKHKEILNQIRTAFDNSSYALANTGLFSIIDSLCSFFVVNKRKNTYRINLFEPILKIEKRESDDYYNILILSMVNNNINFLYSKKNNTHKVARRHPSQHGEFFSNNKIDTIMLLHTTYYLLICIEVYKKYKGKLKLEVRKIDSKIIKEYTIIKKEKSNKNLENKKLTTQ